MVINMINKRIVNILIVMSLLFLTLIGYLTYFEFVLKDGIAQNPFNKRQWAYEEDTVRGSIYDRVGVTLANSDDTVRIYPYGALYSHIIGYNSTIYGKSQLEFKYNNLLLGQDEFSQVFSVSSAKRAGHDLTLTIDHQLQSLASLRLGKRNGAVVALNPKTGEVLALVSKPDFDPNSEELTKKWTDLTESEQSPLLPRATSGLYAPGSTFKIITSTGAIEKGFDGETYTDYGKVTIGGKTFENYKTKAFGKINMERGFEVSSNNVFCTLGAKLGSGELRSISERFGFNKVFDFDISMSKSRFPQKDTDEAGAAALGIGQGEILATPIQMAMVTSAVANNGIIMKPYLLQRATNQSGFVVFENKPQQLFKALSPEVAGRISNMMVNTVKSGTGSGAAIRGLQVAGKTGTAENEQSIKQKGKEHTWFVAFAPAENPQIAVAVMLEYSGGSGGELCAPIARELIEKYFK